LQPRLRRTRTQSEKTDSLTRRRSRGVTVRQLAKEQAQAAETDREYIEQWADNIYVREQVDGKWGAYALSALPPKLAMRHAMRR